MATIATLNTLAPEADDLTLIRSLNELVERTIDRAKADNLKPGEAHAIRDIAESVAIVLEQRRQLRQDASTAHSTARTRAR